MQPRGYIHSQGFLDQARYARYQFRRLGSDVTIGKNRLREDSVNIVFGAHLGFDQSLKERNACVFFNLEQLGEGGASVSNDYMNLLRSSPVIDYDERNLAAYGIQPGDIPVVSFQYAPYLANEQFLPLQDRPIDLLFFGSINDRRKALFDRIESCGWNVSMFDHPLYAEERDQFIGQSKAVFNCHFYETSRFEQARAFHTLSLGTPVISERTNKTTPPSAFENAVTWIGDEKIESFFKNDFMSPDWIKKAEIQLQNFKQIDNLNIWTVAHNYCLTIKAKHSEKNAIWLPKKMNISDARDENYKLGWLNVDESSSVSADISIDWMKPNIIPLQLTTKTDVRFLIDENQLEHIYTQFDLTQIKNHPVLLGNLLRILKIDGRLDMEIPCDTIADLNREQGKPATVNTTRWARIVQRFWELNNLNYRFEIIGCNFVDDKSSSCHAQNAASLLVSFKKIETTTKERSIARVYLPNFGIIEDKLEAETQKKREIANEKALKNTAPMKFVFYTPPYDDNSGGLIAIYKLAHMLNENGHAAKIWTWNRLHDNEIRMINGKVTKEYWVPKSSSQSTTECHFPLLDATTEDINDSIILYPEIIEGNPLGAKKVVRWLLNKPGVITGSSSYGFDDLIFYYAEHFLPEGLNLGESFRLKITDMKTHIYQDRGEQYREGVYYMVRKGKDIPLNYHPKNAIQVDGKSHAELAKIFSKAEMFISYDMHTAYSVFASMCGCDSVVVPRSNITKEQWKIGKDSTDLDGIAYGFDDIERARKSRPLMVARIHHEHITNLKAMENFLVTCKDYLQ